MANMLYPYKKGKVPWHRYKHFAEFLHPDPEPCPDLTPQAASHFNKLTTAFKLWRSKNGANRLAPSIWHIMKVVITAQCLGMRRQEVYRALAMWGSEFTWDTIDTNSSLMAEFPMWHYDKEMGHVPSPVDPKYRAVFREGGESEKSWYLAMPESLKSAFDEWLLANEWDASMVRILVDGKGQNGAEPKLAWHHPELDKFLHELQGKTKKARHV